MRTEELRELEALAKEIRILTIDEIAYLGVGHIGGALSVVDILTLLYSRHLRVDPKDPLKADRDRLVLSKGHAGPALYAVLAKKGFFPVEWLRTLNVGGTSLPSHCDRTKTPGIDMSTGSLGQGISAAAGIALGMRLDGSGARAYCVIGDGESDEGLVWEAAMFAAHMKLDNLTAFTDYNKLQIDGAVGEVMGLEDLSAKWSAFGWAVERVDGHDFRAMDEAVSRARERKGKPSMIILDTVKGKGCNFCEGQAASHNMPVTMEQAAKAIAALG
jgi:transketolase